MQPLAAATSLLPDTGDAILRLAVATLVGSAIGLNRDLNNKPAGVRTHGLVALGSALVTLVSVHFAYAGVTDDGNAVTRTIQGVIAGVGFLGGGVILKTSDAREVRGLTTAATIWLVACLGITAGAGLWTLTAASAVAALVVLVGGGPLEGWVRRRFSDSGEHPASDRHDATRAAAVADSGSAGDPNDTTSGTSPSIS